MTMKALWIIILIALLGVVGFLLFQRGGEEAVQSPQPTSLITQPTVSPSPTPLSSPSPSPIKTVSPSPTKTPAFKTVVVNITDSGFSPSQVTINASDTIRFVNQGSQAHWPASAVHPTHELYPGSGISKCGTAAIIFDACRGLTAGQSFSFTFLVKGTWSYHDHLAPSLRGTIVVE